MSRPTTRLRFSLGISTFPAGDAQREAVRIAQVHGTKLGGGARRKLAERFGIGGNEPRQPLRPSAAGDDSIITARHRIDQAQAAEFAEALHDARRRQHRRQKRVRRSVFARIRQWFASWL